VQRFRLVDRKPPSGGATGAPCLTVAVGVIGLHAVDGQMLGGGVWHGSGPSTCTVLVLVPNSLLARDFVLVPVTAAPKMAMVVLCSWLAVEK
jgi:hypothetical protein